MPKRREITFFERERIEAYVRMKKAKKWMAKKLGKFEFGVRKLSINYIPSALFLPATVQYLTDKQTLRNTVFRQPFISLLPSFPPVRRSKENGESARREGVTAKKTFPYGSPPFYHIIYRDKLAVFKNVCCGYHLDFRCVRFRNQHSVHKKFFRIAPKKSKFIS